MGIVQGAFPPDMAKLATVATFANSTTATLAGATGHSLAVHVSGAITEIHHDWASPEESSLYAFGANLAWLHVPNNIIALVPRDESKAFPGKLSELGFHGLRGIGWAYSSGMIKQGAPGRIAGFGEDKFLAIVGTSVYIGSSVPKENDPSAVTASITGIPLPSDLQKASDQIIGATIINDAPVLITASYAYAQIETTLANGSKSYAWQRSNFKLAATDGTKDFRLAAVHAKVADNMFEPTAIVAVSSAGKVYMWKDK
jgi:hypothetical protein